MTFTKIKYKWLAIQFESATISVSYDKELDMFLETLKSGTADKNDIRVFENYFNINWPVTIFSQVRVPLKFVGYKKG